MYNQWAFLLKVSCNNACNAQKPLGPAPSGLWFGEEIVPVNYHPFPSDDEAWSTNLSETPNGLESGIATTYWNIDS